MGSKVAHDGDEVPADDSSDEGLRGLSRSRSSVIGDVDLDSVSLPPSLWQSSPAHIECTAAAPEYEGDLPSHTMRRLDVGQRSVVGDFQSAVRNCRRSGPMLIPFHRPPIIFKILPVFPLPFCVLRCYVCTPCDAPVSSLPGIILSVDMHARVTPSHSTFSACR